MVALIVIAIAAVTTSIILHQTDLSLEARMVIQFGVMVAVGWATAAAGYSVRDW